MPGNAGLFYLSVYYYSTQKKEAIIMSQPTIKQVVQFMLSKASMSNFKLNQLCFYADAWNFVINHAHFANSNFQAWIHGAIDPEIHNKYENYLNYQFNNREAQYLIPKQKHNIPVFNQDITDVLNQVYSEYGHYTDMELESLIHQSTPWQNARQGLKPLDRSTNTFNDQDLLTWFIPTED